MRRHVDEKSSTASRVYVSGVSLVAGQGNADCHSVAATAQQRHAALMQRLQQRDLVGALRLEHDALTAAVLAPTHVRQDSVAQQQRQSELELALLTSCGAEGGQSIIHRGCVGSSQLAVSGQLQHLSSALWLSSSGLSSRPRVMAVHVRLSRLFGLLPFGPSRLTTQLSREGSMNEVGHQQRRNELPNIQTNTRASRRGRQSETRQAWRVG